MPARQQVGIKGYSKQVDHKQTCPGESISRVCQEECTYQDQPCCVEEILESSLVAWLYVSFCVIMLLSNPGVACGSLWKKT